MIKYGQEIVWLSAPREAELYLDDNGTQREIRRDRFVLPALVASGFATYPATFATMLLLIEIGDAFGASVGVSGLLQSASSLVGVVFAVILSALSVRYSAKSLLIAGLGTLVVAALGCGLAPTFPVMFASYALTGIGAAVIPSMGFTLVAQHLPEERRSSAIGWLVAGATFSGVIGLPAIGYISSLYGWRMAYLGYALPFAVLGLIFSYVGLPSVKRDEPREGSGTDIRESFRAILGDKSAAACLLTSVLAMVAWQASTLYSSAFYRGVFDLPLGATSIFLTVSTLIFSASSLVVSRVSGRLGRKPTTVYALALAGLTVGIFTLVPDRNVSMAARLISSLFVSFTYNASSSLSLDQVPRFRGAMMSLNTAAGSLGGAIGAATGAIVFSLYGFAAIGPFHGALMIIGALVFNILVVDRGSPTKEP
jgi:DHA1 family inner membrane transport protein